jgi:hypothetical protein
MKTPNKRIEPMSSSALCQRLQFHTRDALLVTAHPQRSASCEAYDAHS